MADLSSDDFFELEDEIQQEFYDDVVAAVRDINICVEELLTAFEANVIDRLFRAIHTIKGNCNMVFLGDFVRTTHRLEDLFSKIRNEEVEYDPVYARFALHIVNMIQVQIENAIETKTVETKILESIRVLIDEVQDCTNEERVDIAEKAIAAVNDGHLKTALIVQDGDQGNAFSFVDATDIEFFEFVSSRYRTNSNRQRFYQICSTLAFKLNHMLAISAEENDMRAAIIFLHLSQKVEPNGIATELNLQQCIIASGLLERMHGWTAAAKLCIQAMEYHNGKGLPHSLKDTEILAASQVLSLSFEFAFCILARENMPYKKSLFEAVKIINARKDTQYKEKLIQRFNQLVKSEYLTNQMF